MHLATVITTISALFGTILAHQTQAAKLEVLTIEYPPYVSATLPDYGLNFALLKRSNKIKPEWEISPHFVPPARAQKLIETNQWCASFYPPNKGNTNSLFILLSEQKVRLGLYRQRQSTAFVWQNLEELRGKNVALLRASNNGIFQQQFTVAGMQIVEVNSIKQGVEMLIRGRVDYAFGDNTSIEIIELSDEQVEQLQFSDSSIQVVDIGLYVNRQCAEQILLIPPPAN